MNIANSFYWNITFNLMKRTVRVVRADSSFSSSRPDDDDDDDDDNDDEDRDDDDYDDDDDDYDGNDKKLGREKTNLLTK